MRDKLVSVIITTKNEADVLERLLVSIKNQKYKKTEIIIIDNNSTDDTKKIAKKYSKHVYNKGPERSVQRNFGATKGIGAYFLFLDADMELTKDVIQQCVDSITNKIKTGAVVIPEESVATNYWERVKAFERSFYNLYGDDITDSARFFTREAFYDAGGYDETITGPEDWDLPETIKKLGYKQSRIKAVIYHHERIKSPLRLARKKFYYALKSHRYIKKQKLPTFSPKTVYFLRPVFYKNWRKFIINPKLSVGLFVMLTLELVFGGAGYFIGIWKRN